VIHIDGLDRSVLEINESPQAFTAGIFGLVYIALALALPVAAKGRA